MSTVATSLLPPEVRPLHYRISLSPDLSAFTFAGEETIDIEIDQSTSQIVLNAAELEIQEAYVIRGGQRLSAQAIALDDKDETATLTFATPLATGTQQLSLRFTGVLNDK